MAIDKIQSESINLADNFAFTGTVTGAGESNIPYFRARISGEPSFTPSATTKVQFNAEVFDSANAYDHTTNYRFTAPSAGKYKFNTFMNLRNDNGLKDLRVHYYLNGSQITNGMYNIMRSNNNPFQSCSMPLTVILDLSVNDYIEVYVYSTTSSGNFTIDGFGMFEGFKLTAS